MTFLRRMFLVSLSAFVFASPQLFGQTGTFALRGITRRLLVRPGVVVAIDGRGLTTYDVSSPSGIRRIDSRETERESLDGTFAGSDVFVATRNDLQRFGTDAAGRLVLLAQFPIVVPHVSSNGRFLATASGQAVRLYDSSKRGSLPLLAAYTADATVRALAWHGDDLLIAVQDAGVIVFSAALLQQRGSIGESAVDLVVQGDRLYTASGRSGLAVIDIGDVGAPRLLGRAIPGAVYFNRIAVDGNVVVAGEAPDRFDVFTLTAGGGLSLSKVVDEPTEAIVAGDGRLFQSGSSVSSYGLESGSGVPVRVFDLTRPATLAVLGEFHDLAGPLSGVATDGSSAFVADPPFFRVVDISRTATPREIATLRLEEPQPYVKLLGRQVVLYGNGDAQLIDVSDPFHPQSFGTFHSGGHSPSTAAIAASGVLEGNPYTGFHVIDFFHHASPVQTAGVKTHPYEVVAGGGPVAYVSRERQDLLVIALPSVNDAHIAKVIPLPVIELALAPSSNAHPSLLLARTTTAIHIFSLADPLQPVEIGSALQAAGGVFTADGDRIYVANEPSIRIIDLGDPGAPPTFNPSLRVVAPSQVAVAGGKVVVADRYALRIYGPDTPGPKASLLRRRALRP